MAEMYEYDLNGTVTVLNEDHTKHSPLAPQSRFLFQRRPHDAATGLYDYRMRWYHPGIGQFLTADPAGFASGTNQYALAGGDPVNLTDPFGMQTARGKAPDAFDTAAKRSANALESVEATLAPFQQVLQTTGLSHMTQGLNMATSFWKRVVTFRESGMGKTTSVLSAVDAAIGDIVGFTPLLEGSVGVDLADARLLHGWERFERTALGAVQTIMFVFGGKIAKSARARFLRPALGAPTPIGFAGIEEYSLALRTAQAAEAGGAPALGRPVPIGFANAEAYATALRAAQRVELAARPPGVIEMQGAWHDAPIGEGAKAARVRPPFPGSNTAVVHGPGVERVEAGLPRGEPPYARDFRSIQSLTADQVAAEIASDPLWNKTRPTTLASCAAGARWTVAQDVANGLVRRGALDPRIRAPTVDLFGRDLSFVQPGGRWVTFLGIVK
jgi:RHS repeat-associated protein